MKRREIEREVRKWQKRLHLCDWRVVVRIKKVDMFGNDDRTAQCSSRGKFMDAVLTFATKRSRREIQRAIEHEMVHLALTDVREAADTAYWHLGHEARELHRDAVAKADERATIGIANALACVRKKGR
jgi:hypothetical protein